MRIVRIGRASSVRIGQRGHPARLQSRPGRIDPGLLLALSALVYFALLSALFIALDHAGDERRREDSRARAAAYSHESAAARECRRWDDSIRVAPEGGPTCGW